MDVNDFFLLSLWLTFEQISHITQLLPLLTLNK